MNPTAEEPLRVAAIDIGTNSVRLIVAESHGSGAYVALGDERETTRLGLRLGETGRLAPESVAATLAALERMKATADSFGVRAIRAIATAAMREAENGADIVHAAREIGIEIEVISAQEEAELAMLSVRSNFALGDEPTVVVDIGGGSMEIVTTAGGSIGKVHSLPLGAVRMTEGFVHSDPISDDDWEALCAATDRELKTALGEVRATVSEMIGSGGTFTTLAAMAMGGAGDEGLSVQGQAMTVEEIEWQVSRLRKMPLEDRLRVPGLQPARADIILAGGVVVLRTARYLGVHRIRVNDRGVRDGMILEMISRDGSAASDA